MLVGASMFSAQAAEYIVPSADSPTIQAAINLAAGNADPVNIINLHASFIDIAQTITIDGDFAADHTLLIRPDPGLSGFTRVAIVASHSATPIVSITGDGSSVTLQDLDLLRNTTNASHLVLVSVYADVIIERCRIGSTWPATGAPDFNNLLILYPTDVVVRNCVFFAYQYGTFARAIQALGFTDPANSLFLYNNIVADYLTHGISLEAGMGGVLLVLRNNVAVNHIGAAIEPTAYYSAVSDLVTVSASANTAFTSAANVEEYAFGGALSIAGPATTGFLRFERADAAPSFVSQSWNITPPSHPNPDFYRLIPGSPLHDDPADAGTTVEDGWPIAEDRAVTDDIERDVRPGGDPPHTDRGADQIESGLTAVAPTEPGGNGLLWAAPQGNPAGGPSLVFQAARGGQLTCELFDLAGRRLHRQTRVVAAGEQGSVTWPAGIASGVVLYRITLESGDDTLVVSSGKISVAK